MCTIRAVNLNFDSFEEDLVQSKDGIVVTDLAGKILVINEVAKRIWTIPESVLISKKVEVLANFLSTLTRDSEGFFGLCFSSPTVSK